MRDEFGGDERRGGWMPAEVANRPLAMLDTAITVLLTEHGPRSRLVPQRIERKSDGAAGQSADRPSSQYLRELQDIVLRVPAVHAERVELEQLARVVLVEAALEPPASANRSARSGAD